MVYFLCFQSHLNYAITSWGNSSYTKKLFTLQKQAIRIIMGVRNREHCQPLLQQLNIIPLPSLYIYNCLIIVHKSKDEIATNSDYHTYNTRQANWLRQPKYLMTKSVRNSLNLKLYNVLPEHWKITTTSKFKIAVNYCFYSTEEYLLYFN